MATNKKAKKQGERATAAQIDNTVKALAAAAEIRTHNLKTWPSPFAATIAGLKPYEIRYNDRGFLVGERIRLQEWQPIGTGDKVGAYTGRELLFEIVRLDNWSYGLRDDVVAMTVRPV